MKPFQPKQVKQINTSGEYFRFVSRESCVAREEMWIQWLVDHGCKGVISAPNKNIFDTYVEEKSFLEVLRLHGLHLEKDWEIHIDEFKLSSRRMISRAKYLSQSTKTNNKTMMINHYRAFVNSLYEFCEYIWAAWAVIYHYESQVLQAFPDQMQIIIALEQPIAFLDMKRDVHELSPTAMVNRYSWVNIYSPFDRPYAEKDFIAMRGETDKKEIGQEFRQFGKTRAEFREFADSIKDEELRKKVVMVHTYAYLKTLRIEAWMQAMFYARGFFSYLASLMKGSGMKDAANLTSAEVIDLLGHTGRPDLEQLKERSGHKVLYFYRNGKIEMLNNAKEIRQLVMDIEKKHGNEQSVNGVVAYSGKAKGIVKVISHSDDLGKIGPGDIFVAKFTFPTFTPYMRKSAAVITDEGGITGHAAIISREFKIPCIVGTKHATTVFKDGDIVEVDAEKGIVRKINNFNKQ